MLPQHRPPSVFAKPWAGISPLSLTQKQIKEGCTRCMEMGRQRDLGLFLKTEEEDPERGTEHELNELNELNECLCLMQSHVCKHIYICIYIYTHGETGRFVCVFCLLSSVVLCPVQCSAHFALSAAVSRASADAADQHILD
jgi:hypothetical protein